MTDAAAHGVDGLPGHGSGHGYAHAHGHGHGHGHGHARTASGALKAALALTLTFMGVEVAVGLWSRSLALLADAGHMAADAGALALALVAQHWAAKPRTERSTFGFRRAEVLAAFVNGVALAVAAIWIVTEAVSRWSSPPEVRGTGLLVAATAGLFVNLVAAWILARSRGGGINVRAAMAHVAMDALGSVGAIAAGVLVLGFGIRRADPAISVGIAVLVAYGGWRILRETTRILLESVPERFDVADLERTILECNGVASLHDLHVWSISERFDALTVHVVLERGAHGVEVCRAVSAALEAGHGLTHVTVQPEAPPPEDVVSVRLSRDGRAIGC